MEALVAKGYDVNYVTGVASCFSISRLGRAYFRTS